MKWHLQRNDLIIMCLSYFFISVTKYYDHGNYLNKRKYLILSSWLQNLESMTVMIGNMAKEGRHDALCLYDKGSA